MRVLLYSLGPPSATAAATIIAAGFVVETTQAEHVVVQLVKSAALDAVVADVARSTTAAPNITRQLRAAGLDTPVLVLCDHASPAVRVAALSAGADDYVSKPYDPNELIARLQAITRRARRGKPEILTAGPLRLKIDSQEAFIGGKPVSLTGKEFAILLLLAMRKGTVLTKPAILNHLYQGGSQPDAKIVDVFVCKIRKKLAEAGANSVIGTVWGQGYTVADPSSGGGIHRTQFNHVSTAELHSVA